MENTIQFGEEFDKQEYGLIDDGTYEVAIDRIEQKISKKGGKYLNFTFVIRDDVDQNFKKRRLFYTVSAKEGDACYDFNRVNKMILTQKNTPNFKTHFADFDEVLLYLHGLHMTLGVETNFDDYSGQDRNEVKDFSFAPSEWDKTPHTATADSAASASPATKAVDISNQDDLPF